MREIAQMARLSGDFLKRSRWLRFVGSSLAAALLIYLLSQQGWSEIVAAIRQIAPWRLFLALALMLISRLAVTARWYVLLRSARTPVAFSQVLRITFAGLFASNFLPTTVGGDLVRIAGALQMKLDPAVSAASLIVDRAVGMIGMAMAAPFSLPVWASGGLSNAGFVPPTWALSASPLLRGLETIYQSLVRGLQRIYSAFKLWLRQPGALALSLAFSWVHMLCLFGVISLLLGGVGEEMPLWLIGGLYSLVYFVTLLPVSINGYGVQEFSMTLIFSNLGRASVGSGLIVALLFRTLMMTASLPGAVFIPDILSAARDTPAKISIE